MPLHTGQPGRQTGLEKAKATRTRQSPVLTTLTREEVKKGMATLRDDETCNIAKGSRTLGKTLCPRSLNDNYFRPDVPLTNTEYFSPDAQGWNAKRGAGELSLYTSLARLFRDFQFYLDKCDPDRSMNRQF